MSIDIKDLLDKNQNYLVFDLPNGQILTIEPSCGALLLDLRDAKGCDSSDGWFLGDVMQEIKYEDGVYVIGDKSNTNFKLCYMNYKERCALGGQDQFYDVIKGSDEYLRGVKRTLENIEQYYYIEVKNGVIV